jgi:hypothetical protein
MTFLQAKRFFREAVHPISCSRLLTSVKILAPTPAGLGGIAAEFEEPDNCFFDQIVRATGTGGDRHRDFLVRSGHPPRAFNFLFGVDIKMPDGIAGNKALRVAHEPCRQFFFTNFDEVGCVGAVVAADDEEEVEGLVEEGEEGILPFLGGAAYGVKVAVVGCASAVAVGDGRPNPALDFLGFTAEHGRLIGDAHAGEVLQWVEAGRAGVAENFEKRGGVARMADKIANGVRLLQIQYDEVVARAVGSQCA